MSRDLSATVVTRLMDLDRNTDAVEQFVASKRDMITYPVALDNAREATKFFGIPGTPTMYAINANNQVIYKHIGSMEDADWAELRALLAK